MITAGAVTVAAGAGAAIKMGIKYADAKSGGREYDSAGYDAITGGVNGFLAPITAGFGGAVGKTVATRLGVQVVKEGAEVVAEQGVKEVAGQAVQTGGKSLIEFGNKYVSENLFKRGAAYGAESVTIGATSGAPDAYVRNGLTTGHWFDENAAEATGQGLMSGALTGPLMDGGFRVAGKFVQPLIKFGDKITSAYSKAESASINNVAIENPNAEIIRGLGGVIKQAQSLISDYNEKNTSAINFAGDNIDAINNLTRDAIEQAQRASDSQLYKHLGDLPSRGKRIYNTLTADVNTLDKTAKAAREKILSGDIKEGLANWINYSVGLDEVGSKVGQQILHSSGTLKNAGIAETAEVLTQRLNKRISNPAFTSLPKEAQAQAIIEDSNILLAKFIQTFSSDESLPNNARTFFKQFTSNATSSRNLKQAQVLSDELYGNDTYKLVKSAGVGTIGETYFAKDKNGQEVVIKILKDGVTPEKFAADRKAFTGYISEFVSDPAEKEYKLKMINGLFDSWDKELNFGLEAQGAKEMAVGAKRFKVVQTLQVGTKNGQNISIVMEKANGIGLDNLIDMIKFKKEHPVDFLTKSIKTPEGKELNPWIKNVDFVEKNPLLVNSDDWMKNLPKAYKRAQNEQAIFVSKTGGKTVHADPHGGNVFVDFDNTGKPKITYIDTGNVVKRTNIEVIQDVGLSLNMMIGNSKGIAVAILDGASLPSGFDQIQMAEKVAELLDERLFKAGVNIKNVSYTQTTIDGIMKELNIIPNTKNSNLMKATLQRIKTLRELSTISGITLDILRNKIMPKTKKTIFHQGLFSLCKI